MNEVAIPVVAILAWAAIVLLKIYQGMRRREMVHRERLAMIERGLVPPPETDPQRFERAMGLHPGHLDRPPGHGIRPGLILIAVGIGVGVLISLTSGNFGAGIGVGTLLVLLGIALLIGAVWESSVVREFVERAVTGEDRHGPRPESSSPTEPRPPR